MKIKVLGVKTGSSSSDKSWFAGWNIFYTLIGVGVLLLILLLLAVIARRHHHEKTGGQSDDDKKDEPKEEVAEVVETEEPQIVKGKKSKNK
jgi:flagellar biosynthesis/type III secretory pathway M-ring protein FliF/YscJ